MKLRRVKEGFGVMIRTVSAEHRAHGGFLWPAAPQAPGEFVTAPDWDPTARCGGGLHGCLWGQGGEIIDPNDPSRVWQAVLVLLSEVVDLGRKIKVPRGRLIAVGDRATVCTYVASLAPKDVAVPYATATAGVRGTATAGDSGTATAGDSGTATAGDSGTATAGVRGTATAGVRGTATAGYGGTATAGVRGTATAGVRGTATAGYGGTATAGEKGEIRISYWDPKAERDRTAIGFIGEDGLEPGTVYRLDESRRFVPAGSAK